MSVCVPLRADGWMDGWMETCLTRALACRYDMAGSDYASVAASPSSRGAAHKWAPVRVTELEDKTIVEVACGAEYTMARASTHEVRGRERGASVCARAQRRAGVRVGVFWGRPPRGAQVRRGRRRCRVLGSAPSGGLCVRDRARGLAVGWRRGRHVLRGVRRAVQARVELSTRRRRSSRVGGGLHTAHMIGVATRAPCCSLLLMGPARNVYPGVQGGACETMSRTTVHGQLQASGLACRALPAPQNEMPVTRAHECFCTERSRQCTAVMGHCV